MTTQWSAEARDVRARAALLLAETIGHTENGLAAERMTYMATVKRLDRGEITAEMAIEEFEGILERQRNFSAGLPSGSTEARR
ncbi:hypothetical protein [Herbiconiux sp. VKM Ac-2851]|uniref:hypothetical protein n=1 Tax=Herbiconiux sp. VKM Ac-2851 TaxID=2739025 RepID=UPI001566D181|nr:hypothetical protein [Herbiconiux sp. VKM Ac-2851]NQX37147.1 hypothetical protein [Herbiconiux sp. VKM Ac-2851]